jgi:hypothetical protein
LRSLLSFIAFILLFCAGSVLPKISPFSGQSDLKRSGHPPNYLTGEGIRHRLAPRGGRHSGWTRSARHRSILNQDPHDPLGSWEWKSGGTWHDNGFPPAQGGDGAGDAAAGQGGSGGGHAGFGNIFSLPQLAGGWPGGAGQGGGGQTGPGDYSNPPGSPQGPQGKGGGDPPQDYTDPSCSDCDWTPPGGNPFPQGDGDPPSGDCTVCGATPPPKQISRVPEPPTLLLVVPALLLLGRAGRASKRSARGTS